MSNTKPLFTLEYFGSRGRAEYIRLVLEEAGQGEKYEYKVIERPQWDSVKQNMDNYPFRQVPRLVDVELNLNLVQGNATCRHLARKFNLYGATIEEQAKADMFADAAEDLRIVYYRAIYNRNGDFNEGVKNITPEIKGMFEELEYQLKKNGHKYFVSDNVTYADFLLFEMVDIMPKLIPGILDAFPLLRDFHARVESRPNIAAYIASGRRPAMVNGNGKGC